MEADLEFDELEFAYREYVAVTDHMLDVFERLDGDAGVPERIRRALLALATAINEEWG